MVQYLWGQRLFGFVDGSSPSLAQFLPSTTIVNLKYPQWVQQDQMILSALISFLTEPLIAQVILFSSSRVVWSALEFLFQSQSQAHLVHLQYRFATLKKGSNFATNYFCKLKTLNDTPVVVGKTLSSTKLATYLLASLGPSCDSFCLFCYHLPGTNILKASL